MTRAPRGTPLRVLIIQDSRDQAQLIANELAGAGFNLGWRRVDSVAKFEEALGEQAWDVVLCDHFVPGFGSTQAVRAAIGAELDTTLIIVSAQISQEFVAAALQDGAAGYVTLDQLEQLVPTVRRGLAVADARRRQIAAEQASRQATVLHETVLETMPSAYVAVDDRGAITAWNRAAELIFGWSRSQALGRQTAELIIPERHRAAHRASLDRHRIGGDSRLLSEPRELSALRADGTEFPIEITIAAAERDGRPAFHAFVVDISDRKRAEEALRLADERFRRAFDHAPIGMSLLGMDGVFLSVNRALAEMLGRPVEALVGTHVAEVTDPEDQAADAAAMRRMAAGEQANFKSEKRYVHADGHRVWASLSASVVNDLRGQPQYFVSQQEDITAARRSREALRETQAQLQAIFDHVPAGLALRGLDGRYLQANTRLANALGCTPEGLFGHELAERVDPEVIARVRADEREIVSSRVPVTREVSAVDADGTDHHFDFVSYPVLDDHGEVSGFGAFSLDVTDRKRAERALQVAAEERFRRVFDQAPIGMALISADGRIQRANAALGTICGRTRTELEGLRLLELVHPADREQSDAIVNALADADTEEVTTELRFMPAAGAAVDVSAHLALLRDQAGEPESVLCQFQDVTERKLFEEQLRFMADHDPLTGLMNRRKFELELDRHIAHVRRYHDEGALIVLDIDNFKQVNDTLGHNAGDELIVSIAAVLRERLRESDLLARLGGDEFAVLLPKADDAEATHVARALATAVRMNSAMLGGQRKKVTISIGVTTFERGQDEDDDLSGETVLIEADLAMYDTKDAGGDGYAFYAASPHRVSRPQGRLTWTNRIEHALETDRFALVAQPIFDLRSAQVRHHELLIRILDEHDDLIPPASFLYIAERFGLIARLDQWVTTHAIELIERHPELELSVNISGRSLGDQHLLEAIKGQLGTNRIAARRLILEVTETAAVANITQAQAFAQDLRGLGCRFALDDFGAGFGSFYYLKHLPFDYIKIDGEFVQHAATGRIDQLVIEAVVGIAQGLGRETIAEFVSDEKTLRAVQRLGVDYAQGYHIGKPVRVSELF